MENSYYSRIEKKIQSFPSLPTSVADIMRIVSNPESSAKELTQAILVDQSMCVAILKYANSVLYGMPKQVNSLESAIMVLGFDEIQNIALSRSVLMCFGDIFDENEPLIADFWDHSFTCALAAKIIADHLTLQSPGQYFIAGLIHDIGKLAMLMTFPDEYSIEKWLVGHSDKDKLEEEKTAFSMTHAEVGGRLLEKWFFPDSLIAGLQHHHNPQQEEKHQAHATLLQMADAMAFLCCNKEEREGMTAVEALKSLLPDIEHQWKRFKLPWDEIRFQTWFNFLDIDRQHGNSILSILAY